jgi:preprotein translocase subunit Sss1
MKVTREKPEILRFIYRQEQDDPHYGSCLWAIFDLDPGRGLFNVQSDCGNYAYRWPERGMDFLKLLAGNMTDSYLLGKLCGKPKEFNAEATVEAVREYLKDAEYNEDEQKNRLFIDMAVKPLESEFSEYDLSDEPGIADFILDNWNSDNNMGIDCAWELVEKEYGAWQKRIVTVFKEHIVPEIRKAIMEGAYHGADDED